MKKLLVSLQVFILLFSISLFAENSSGDLLLSERNFKSGYYFYNRRNYAAAIDFFRKSLSLQPRDVRSRISLGQTYFMAGYLKNALTEWQIALNFGGGGSLLRNKLNYLYYTQGLGFDKAPVTPYIPLKIYNGYRRKKFFFNRPSGIAVDSKNRMFVAGFESGSIVVLNHNGAILSHLQVGLKRPYDIVLEKSGNLIVSDFGSDTIYRIDVLGKHLLSFGGLGYAPGKFAGPEGVVVDSFGNILVADSGNHRIQKFSSSGKFMLLFGKKGSGPGEFKTPADIIVTKNGNIVVADSGNGRLQMFDASGNFLKIIGAKQLEEPRGLSLLSDGRFLIGDSKKGVVIYNPNGSIWNRIESTSGIIKRPMGVTSDRNGLLYVTDFDSSKVTTLIPKRLKYANLDVGINQTLEFDFPSVQHTVTVRDRRGKPVTGLNKNNFRIFERGIQIEPISLAPTFESQKKVSFMFLVDKSEAMRPYQKSLKRVMRVILQNFSSSDSIQVLNFGSKAWISQRYISNVLSPIEGGQKGNFSPRAVVGRALYKGVRDLFPRKTKQAIVLFTTADFVDADYNPFGFNTCLHFAKNNGVPVYIVLFNKGSDISRLNNLAKATGGEVFDAFVSNRVHKLRNIVMKRASGFYRLVYDTVAPALLGGSYRDFKIEVNYKGLFGYDRSGYYIPKK